MVIVLFIKKFVLLLFILIMGVIGMNAATDELDYAQISGALRASIASSQAKRHGMDWHQCLYDGLHQNDGHEL